MPVLYGTREASMIGPRSAITIDYPAPQEDLLGSPVALPLTEPGTPQISITVGSGDMPVLTGVALADVTLIPLLYVSGANPTGDPHTIHIRVYQNGDEVANVAEANADAYWTYSLYAFAGVAVDDVITIALWDDVTGCSYDYSALAIVVSSPAVAVEGDILMDVVYADVANTPVLTLGSPGVFTASNEFLVTSGTFLKAVDSDRTFGVIQFDASFAHLYIVAFGDPNNLPGSLLTGSDTLHPYYLTNKVPMSVAWDATSIHVTT